MLDDLNDALNEEQFMELAAGKRKVQTAEGAKFYGQPIGTWITPDMIKAKGEFPGGSTDSSTGKAPTGAEKTLAAEGTTSKDIATQPGDAPAKESSISGPNSFVVGDTQFSAPAGSRIFRSKSNGEIVYILTPDKGVHVFNPSGEVPVPEYLEPVLSDKFYKMKGEDALYIEETFDAQVTQSLADELPGAVLNKNGLPVFVKQEDGTWLNSDLGASLTDEDLQGPYENGAFDLQSAQVEEVDFSKMSQDEIEAALESFPEGKELSFGNNKVTLQKDADGNWVSSATGVASDSQTIAQISVGTTLLGDKVNVAVRPEPKGGKNKKEEVVDPLLDPENEINEANTQKRIARDSLAKGADVLNAEIGAVLYHDELGKLTKVEEFGWENEDQTKLFSESTVSASTGQGHVSKKPWKIEEPKEEKVAEEPKPDSSSESSSEPDEAEPLEEWELELLQGLDDSEIPELEESELADMEAAVSDEIPEVDEDALDAMEAAVLNAIDSAEPEPKKTDTGVKLGTTLFATDEVEAAIESLENHSGFQIAYGLKSLDSSNPLKDKDIQAEVVAEAKQKFPNQTPKQALLSHLKTSLKDDSYDYEPLANWEKELLYGDDAITIGSSSPKNTATGVTGGVYTKQDIQNAIDLLEGFEGKAFKSYLNKNGNPLGELSPNDIVGFNKDKTITKNNFLALLKSKLARKDAPAPVDEPEDDEYPLKAKDVISLPVGSVVAEKQGQGVYWTKLADNVWDADDGFGEVSDSDFEGSDFKLISTPEVKSEDSNVPEVDTDPVSRVDSPEVPDLGEDDDVSTAIAEPTKTWEAGQTVQSVEEMNAFPEGTVLHWNSLTDITYGYNVVKNSKGSWDSDKAGSGKTGKDISAVLFSVALGNGQVTYVSDPDSKDAPEAPKFENGHVLISDPSAKKIGGQAGSNEGGLYELDTPEGVKKFYVKKAQSQNHGANESLANAFYRELGVNAPNVDFASDGNLYSEIVDGEQNMDYMISDASWRDKVQKDFAIDAWLSNRDVFGMVYDNILTDDMGNPWRIDNGGALQYRAMGEAKTDFGNEVTEIEIFRKGKKAAVFGPDVMPLENELDGAKRLQALTPERISEMVTEYGVDSDVTDIMIARRQYLMDYYDLSEPTAPEPIAEEFPNLHSIAPGKYNTGKGAKAHLWVKADGTGVYQGMKGILKPLDAEGVKKNYDAGMSTLVATPNEDQYPSIDGDDVPTSKGTIPGLGGVDTLPDGVYSGPKGETYTIQGDKATINSVVKTAAGLSIGKKVTKSFMEAAPVGTVVRNTNYSTENLVVKQEDGSWKAQTNAAYHLGYMGGTYNYYAKRFVVDSFPNGEPEEVSKASLKTKYVQGKLIDANGNSVFPPGYSGAISFFGAPTTVGDLKLYRDYLADPDIELADKATAHGLFSMNLNTAKMKDTLPASSSPQEYVDSVVQYIDDYLASAFIPKKEKAKDPFVKDEYGFYQKPEAIVTAPYTDWDSSASTLSSVASTIAASVGGGDIIGTQLTSMSKGDKSDWISYVKGGNFNSAYELEVKSANSKDKALLNATLHPGHPLNKETHTITWAGVPGEIPATVEIPGEWSSSSISPSLAEADNYLIAAKMQNPTYLTEAAKKQWVLAHKKNNKALVDAYSEKALYAKNSGVTPYSPEPVWTDNLEPSYSYTALIESTQFPQTWFKSANATAAADYYAKMSGSDPELVALHDKYKEAEPYNPSWYWDAQALNDWFAKKEHDYLEELNKPVYSVVQTISTGTHQVYIVSDQFDRKKIFKPLTPGKEWRAESAAAAHSLGKALGFNVPGAAIGEVNEGIPMGTNNRGILMDFAPNVGSFGDLDGAQVAIESLTPEQFGQLASEHVFDWLLDNDDTHSENMLIGESGELIAIDKDRAFLQYGHWFGLSTEDPESLNINTYDSGDVVIYHQMMSAIRSGEVSQEQMDAAYKGAKKAAKRVQKTPDSQIEKFVRAATEHRDNWETPDYAQSWPTMFPSPTSQDELVTAVLSRKNSMVEDIDAMWTKLYALSGHSKPETPAKLLGEGIPSGWEESDLVESVEASKVWGTAPVHASSAFSNGASLLWTEKTSEGESHVAGKFKLGSLAQKNVVEFLKGKVSFNGMSQMDPIEELKGYPTSHVKALKKSVTYAGKDISNNATSGNYDPTVWKNFLDAEAKVDADIAFAGTADMSGASVKFPSGVSVPTDTVPQYLLALDHHKNLSELVKQAKANKVGTSKDAFKDFYPPKWKVKGTTYQNAALGEQYKLLSNNSWMHTSQGKAQVVKTLPESVTALEDGWTTPNAIPAASMADPEKYSLSQAGQYAGTLNAGGEKILTDSFSSEGHYGQEVRIDLPTGERVFFRNSSITSTQTSQQGDVRFELNPEYTTESSLANVENYLNKWGLDMSGADEDSAEVVYWRQMFRRIIESNGNGETDQVREVRLELRNRQNELRSTLDYDDLESWDIVEAISLVEEDEAAYWNNLAMRAFGADKVNAFLAEGKHLPQYQHMDLSNPEVPTGLPYFNRIDVSLEDVYDKGTFIAIGNQGKDDRHFDYIKSGGMASTEERLRILGVFKNGQSSAADQESGGANNIFTRIATGQAKKSGALVGDHTVYWSPAVLTQTGTYSYSDDSYGRVTEQTLKNPTSPLYALENFTSGGNETLVPNNLSIYDFMEIMVFEKESKRLKAIEEFKKLGLEMLRGVPIEDRLVLRVNLTQALNTVKAAWS